MRRQPALFVPAKFFAGQPAHALDISTFNLTDIDRRVYRVAGVVQDIGLQ